MKNDLLIKDITAEQLSAYKTFLTKGLIEAADNFRMSPGDDRDAPFPTRGTNDSFTLGMYADGALAGVVSFERDGTTREKMRHKAIMFRMYVAPQYRGMGIARKLIDELLLRVNSLSDIEQINLTVIAHNTTAIKLYESYGFTTFSSEEHAIKWKGQYFTENQMMLRLW